MDFEFTKEQVEIRKSARKFAKSEFPQIAKEIDAQEKFPFELWEKASEVGFIGCYVPEKYGGVGYGITEHCCIAEEFWRVDPGCGQCLCSVAIGAEVIELFGSDDQKKTFLIPVVTGEKIMGIAITEPNSGSDAFSVSTEARKEGNEYILNGQKTFITNGSIGHFLVVFCVTDQEAENYRKRFSMIIVETDRPGFKSQKMSGKLGVRGSDTSEVWFNNVRVPEKNRIGVEGEGAKYLMGFFNRSRLMVAAFGVGLAQGAMELGVNYIQQRRQFGRRLADFQVNRSKVAEMATFIEAARCLTYKATQMADNGQYDKKLVAMAKWFSGWIAVRTADEALQMHGGYGYMGEYDISRFYRDAKILEIYEGTKEVEKEIVANSILK